MACEYKVSDYKIMLTLGKFKRRNIEGSQMAIDARLKKNELGFWV